MSTDFNTEEKPDFSSQTIGETKTPATKPKHRVKNISDDGHGRIKTNKKQKIDQQITAIYEDANGKIPDMKQIEIKKTHPFIRNLTIFVLTAATMAVIAWVGFFVLPTNNKFSEIKLVLKIEGPSEITVGATTTYSISFANEQDIRLKNAVLTITYPEGFVFIESSKPANNAGHTEWMLDDLLPNSEGQMTITGKTFGTLNQEYSWSTFLTYQPVNFNSEMQKIATLKIKISESPFSIALTGPDKTTVGENAEYLFTVKNSSDWWPESLELIPSLPINFYPASSSPALNKDKKWIIKTIKNSSSTLVAQTEYKFKLIGKFSDFGGTVTENLVALSAELYIPGAEKKFAVANGEIKSELIKNNYNFSLAINGSMTDLNSQPGDTLNITIYLKNDGQETIKKGVLKLILDSPSLNRRTALDWTNVNDPLDGLITGEQINNNIRRGTIKWTEKDLSTLSSIKPGQEIGIDLQLPIRDSKVFDLAELVEYQVKTLAEINFLDSAGKTKSLSANPINITLNSDFKFESRDSQTVKNGIEKRDITWVLTNTFHPLKNIELSAELFGDINFYSASPTPAGILNYDQDTKKIIWTIAEMPLNLDILALPFTITINTKNPSQSALISKIHIRAEDSITGKTFDFMSDETPLEYNPVVQQ
ncbi:MAG: hypothetical protein COU29_01205 [Candidatus Magasanikbacteria bacterium CG10_big_fil_rev_8_21_14_0_10_36_32]|uniref:DUF11 domain-containing protein n=1 Tax=Candidatus Magasanikbacteria bacterium CG10_big_fil_rev_8_21_14_0_10_36_32 TaxID=1974646 RepID=A0A2M6W6H8_9BACT|nr:MAG: hypothetical protein COU29_01205 [Candidatus Magasanikbacteria bacterium CG10_big_fil_rev_8_21_14_0_10_36_32]